MSLVVRQIATYREIVEFWDIDEVHAVHEILDIQADMEADALAEMKAETGTGRGRGR